MEPPLVKVLGLGFYLTRKRTAARRIRAAQAAVHHGSGAAQYQAGGAEVKPRHVDAYAAAVLGGIAWDGLMFAIKLIALWCAFRVLS